jgi:hypothetical protein
MASPIYFSRLYKIITVDIFIKYFLKARGMNPLSLDRFGKSLEYRAEKGKELVTREQRSFSSAFKRQMVGEFVASHEIRNTG